MHTPGGRSVKGLARHGPGATRSRPHPAPCGGGSENETQKVVPIRGSESQPQASPPPGEPSPPGAQPPNPSSQVSQSGGPGQPPKRNVVRRAASETSEVAERLGIAAPGSRSEGDHVEPGTVVVVNLSNPLTPAPEKMIEVGVYPDDAFLLGGAP